MLNIINQKKCNLNHNGDYYALIILRLIQIRKPNASEDRLPLFHTYEKEQFIPM